MSDSSNHWRAAQVFLVTGIAAIIAGGLVAAAVTHRPTQPLVWMSAYLVLVVGVGQLVFGLSQAWLSANAPKHAWLASEWIIFNLGNVGVIVGTLAGMPSLVIAGTVLFIIGIALFLAGTRGRVRPRWLTGYRVLLGLVFLTSLVGLVLTFVKPLH